MDYLDAKAMNICIPILVAQFCVTASRNPSLLREREVMWEMGRERREEGDGGTLVVGEVNFINS